MSNELISRSPDLKLLRDEGYEVTIVAGHLVVSGVPYLNASGSLSTGSLISELTLAGDITAKPSTHVIHWSGEFPHKSDGREITALKHASGRNELAPGLVHEHSFSNKPPDGYPDYYSKVTRYVEIISAHAKVMDPASTACTFRVIEGTGDDGPFVYLDSASSRYGIAALSARLALESVAIVGLGGTGSYVLDLIAKTPIKAIRLFDGDRLLQHNAFRAPGAVPLQALRERPFKTDYFRDVYSSMHRGIHSHPVRITGSNIAELSAMSFVFVCIDHGPSRKEIAEALQTHRIPFIDVGMGLQFADDGSVLGMCRVTTHEPKSSRNVMGRLPCAEGDDDGPYSQEAQIADLNALNATLAVIRWKKLQRFYQDLQGEHHSAYAINVNQLTSEECDEDPPSDT